MWDQNTLARERWGGQGAKCRSGVQCFIAVCAPSNEQTNDVWHTITTSPHLLHISDRALLKNTLHVWLSVCGGRADWPTESFSSQFQESRSHVTMETVQVCFCLDFSKTCHYKGWNLWLSLSSCKNTFLNPVQQHVFDVFLFSPRPKAFMRRWVKPQRRLSPPWWRRWTSSRLMCPDWARWKGQAPATR